MSTATAKAQDELAEQMISLRDNPLGFVMFAFPWGVPGTVLEHCNGPEKWQSDFLELLGREIRKRGFDGNNAVDAVNIAVRSGHGVGKTTLTAWIILFMMSTRPSCQGPVTANTGDQLKDKTWAELGKWWELSINRHWFDIGSSKGNLRIWGEGSKTQWFMSGQTCRKENANAFAGLHNRTSSSVYIFDEASEIAREIWEVAEGGKTDGEPFHFVFGNPTAHVGAFRDCFGKQRHRWIQFKVDSREVSFTNKAIIQQWIDDYGEDSDFVRVRVKGDFPRASSNQLIPSDAVFMCRKREIPDSEISGYPKTIACDVARFGGDNTVISWRQGRKARILKTYNGRDTMVTAGFLAEYLSTGEYSACFIDDTGVGGGVSDRVKQLGYDVIRVNAGESAIDELKYKNKRAEMWAHVKEWIIDGADLPDNPALCEQLEAQEYFFSGKQQLQLVSKKDMKMISGSPDEADSLCLHFAYPVNQKKKVNKYKPVSVWGH